MSLMEDDEIDAWWRQRELEASGRMRRAVATERCDNCGAAVLVTDKTCHNCKIKLCKGCR